MSEWIKCDRCNKITKADSSGEKRYKIGVDGFDGYSTFHVCEWCLRSFYLDYLGWVWNDDEKQYVPQERSEGYDVGRAKRNLQHALKWNDKADPEALKTAISALEEAERLCEGN